MAFPRAPAKDVHKAAALMDEGVADREPEAGTLSGIFRREGGLEIRSRSHRGRVGDPTVFEAGTSVESSIGTSFTRWLHALSLGVLIATHPAARVGAEVLGGPLALGGSIGRGAVAFAESILGLSIAGAIVG